MTRDIALDDPEVRADIAQRDASTRDRSRSSLVNCDDCGDHVRDHDFASGQCNAPGCDCQGFVRGGGPTWSPPAIVERWPCTSCNALVDMPQDAIDVFQQMQRLCARQGQRPLPRRVPCEACKRAEALADQARRRPQEQRTIAGLEPGRKGRP